MTPSELARDLFRELSPVAPKLAAEINRALLDVGGGSVLVGMGPGFHRDDTVTWHATERIDLSGIEAPVALARIAQAVARLEEHSSWHVIVDPKPRGTRDTHMDLLYTLMRLRED